MGVGDRVMRIETGSTAWIGRLSTWTANTSVAADEPLGAAGKPAQTAICMMTSVISPRMQPTVRAP